MLAARPSLAGSAEGPDDCEEGADDCEEGVGARAVPEVGLVDVVVEHPLSVQQVVHGDHVLRLAHAAGPHPPQLLRPQPVRPGHALRACPHGARPSAGKMLPDRAALVRSRDYAAHAKFTCQDSAPYIECKSNIHRLGVDLSRRKGHMRLLKSCCDDVRKR